MKTHSAHAINQVGGSCNDVIAVAAAMVVLRNHYLHALVQAVEMKVIVATNLRLLVELTVA